MSISSAKVWRTVSRVSLPGTRIIPGKGVFTQQIVPLQGQNELKDLQHVLDVTAGVHGLKIIIVPDEPSLNYVASGLVISYLNLLDGKFSLGVATGGTWEPARYVFGMPEFSRESFNGQSFPVEKMEYCAPLDDYDYTRTSYERTQKELGPEEKFISVGRLPWTYFGEHRVWLDRLGFGKKALISPNYGLDEYSITGDIRALYDGDFNHSAKRFLQVLNEKVRPTALQCYGIGTCTGHVGFNENGVNADTFTRSEKRDILLKSWKTRGVRLHDITLLQNASAFFPLNLLPEDQKIYDAIKMFRNIGGTYGLISFEDIFAKASFLVQSWKKPKELDYVSDDDWAFFVENFDSILDRAISVTQSIMPPNGITQGTADLRSYDGTHWTSGMDLVLALGGWKRKVVKSALEGPLTPACAASVLRTFYNPVFIVTADSASELSKNFFKNCFYFIPDESTEQKIKNFTAENIRKLFWQKK